MKNKKAQVFNTIVRAAILLALLAVILGIIYFLFVGKQIPFLAGTTEEVTTDCDDDGVIGLSDDCPCNDDIKKLPTGQKTCRTEITGESETNCPVRCKITTQKNGKIL